MRAVFIILVLAANSAAFYFLTDGDALGRIELTVPYVLTSTLIVILAHVFVPEVRNERAGKRLEFFGFVAGIAGLVASDAISQKPVAAVDFEAARERVINERNFIKQTIDEEIYDPFCQGWTKRARAVSREIRKEKPGLSPEEKRVELRLRFNPIDQTCLSLWDARFVREEGDLSRTLATLKQVAADGIIPVEQDVIADLENFSTDPYVLALEAEEARARSDFLAILAGPFEPFANFLILMALSIGAGRTFFLSFFPDENAPKSMRG